MENMNDYQIQDGDIRKVRRVEIRDDWDSPEQIAHPVSEEKVQEYLKNKSDTCRSFGSLWNCSWNL